MKDRDPSIELPPRISRCRCIGPHCAGCGSHFKPHPTQPQYCAECISWGNNPMTADTQGAGAP